MKTKIEANADAEMRTDTEMKVGLENKSDIEKAKRILKEENLTCVLCKDKKMFKSAKTGIAPMLDFTEQGHDLWGFSAADKIVGRAAAFLFVASGISCVHAGVLSVGAELIFKKFKVTYSFDKKTENIINRHGTGLCPMETAVAELNNPAAAYEVLKRKVESMKKNN